VRKEEAKELMREAMSADDGGEKVRGGEGGGATKPGGRQYSERREMRS